MNQPHDAIRPRHRRRQPMEATNPAVARAEQSTRVLIRVPTVSIGLTPAAPRTIEQPSTIHEQGETKHVRSETNLASTGSQALLNDTTAKKLPGSPLGPSIREPAPRLSAPLTGAKLPPEVPPPSSASAQPAAPSQWTAKPQLRVDAAHADSSGPHSAAEPWLEQRGSWLADLLQRRSLLAIALIVAAVVGIAIMLHNQAQHHTIRSSNDPGANASHNDLKNDVRYPAAAGGAPTGQDNQNLTGSRAPAGNNSNGMLGSVLSAEQSRSAVPGPTQTVPGSQYGAEDPRFGYPAAAPGQWKAPAGANIPASIEPLRATRQPSAAANPPGMGQESFIAQRDVSPPTGSANLGPSGGAPSAATFEGGIINPYVQFSR